MKGDSMKLGFLTFGLLGWAFFATARPATQEEKDTFARSGSLHVCVAADDRYLEARVTNLGKEINEIIHGLGRPKVLLSSSSQSTTPEPREVILCLTITKDE
jgi:hypothetical protein